MLPALLEVPNAHSLILPEGIHQASVHEIEEHFVDAFPLSSTRRDLLAGWQALRYLVRSTLPVKHEYVDGSFVTSKQNPRDIDVSFWVDGDEFLALPPEAQHALSVLVDQPAYELFKVDGYLVFECPPGHPLYEQFVDVRDWTQEAWRTTRDKRWQFLDGVYKGYVEVVD